MRSRSSATSSLRLDWQAWATGLGLPWPVYIEHKRVSPDRLSRLNLNGVIRICFFAGVVGARPGRSMA